MIRVLSALPLKAYIAVSAFARKIREDEDGLSGVVVAVLLILIAILAVVIIWGSLGTWISDLWTRITGASDGIK